MKVIREITFEGTEEQLEKQCKSSAPNGIWNLPNGLTIKIEVIEMPKSNALMKAINYYPTQWPYEYMEKD